MFSTTSFVFCRSIIPATFAINSLINIARFAIMLISVFYRIVGGLALENKENNNVTQTENRSTAGVCRSGGISHAAHEPTPSAQSYKRYFNDAMCDVTPHYSGKIGFAYEIEK